MEIFKDVKGYEGIYQVSNLGNVKSLSRLVDGRSNFKKQLNEKILKNTPFIGYFAISLCNNKEERFLIHRLVAIAFIPNPENKPCVNHINGIRSDNKVENLEWCTYLENSIHATNTGLKNDRGVNNSRAKLSIQDVIFIRNCNLKGSELAKKYNVNQTVISKVRLFYTYK